MSNAIKLRVLGLAVLTAAASGCVNEAAPESVKADQAVVKIRHQVDEARGRIWLLTRSGVVVFDVTAPRPIRRVPLPGWMWAGEPYGCLPDLALGPKGEALVSSDVVPTLWRVDPETLEVSLHALALDADADKDIGFSELQYSAEQNAYIAVSTFTAPSGASTRRSSARRRWCRPRRRHVSAAPARRRASRGDAGPVFFIERNRVRAYC
jgi:hypothetical protein